MDGFLLTVSRDHLTDRDVLDVLRDCVVASRQGVLLHVDGLTVPGDTRPAALLVVGSPPPYDGRPARALLLGAPRGVDEARQLAAWLADDAAELVDLPLDLSGLLLEVVMVAPQLVPLADVPESEGHGPRPRA